MPGLDFVYKDEEVLEVHRKALTLMGTLADEFEIPESVLPNLYNSVTNMVATVRQTQVVPGTILPRMEVPKGH